MATESEAQKEAKRRLEDARKQKALRYSKIRDAYRFAAPERFSDLNSNTAVGNASPPQDAGDLSTSVGMEAAEDFVTEVINAYMPEGQIWAKLQAASAVPDNQKKRISEDSVKLNAAIFEDIGSSNFVAACAMGFNPDLAVGTVGMWIDDERPGEPPVCQPIPIREMELNVGPGGTVDDRFFVQQVRSRDLAKVLSDEQLRRLPEKVRKLQKEKPDTRIEVAKGYWRDWSDRGQTAWKHVVLANKEMVGEEVTLRGEGCCPMVVGRFGPDPLFAFASGPTIRSLPELNSLDEVRVQNLEHLDYAVHPPYSYPSDGVFNFDNVLQPGMGVPIEPGRGDDFKSLYFEGKWEAGYLEQDDMRRIIRRLHYVDYPEQRGDTPPTATQWLDEVLKAQRRLGTPGRVFFQEFCVEAHRRFMYLYLMRRGLPLGLLIDGKTISLRPYNPADRARDNQEVQIANNLLMMLGSFAPQLSQVLVDQPTTFTNIKNKLGDRLVAVNDVDQATLMQSAMALSGGGMPSAGSPAG